MMRPNYIADDENPCYCGESCEETGKRWNWSVLCSVCKAHTKHEHCDESHCMDAAGRCACHVCGECGEFVDDGEKYCAECDKSCGQDCGCDSRTEHDAAIERSRLDFLRDPGPAPAHFTPEQTARAAKGIAEAQRKAGLPVTQ